ncbi:mannitol dehydrogenase family protein [Brachybacterium endophyticum]|uniref:Mannitol dehydrogenase family protein n=1 Tax=Brachybacterium endophyticum TaxID=2182385 RepID=A0A2U2RK64_9MICO|nr:mannitol dehydrogenase family protein [Brachybacterium endophyticum]PWH06257.1 mannitol dehydrogenase family protein [Brachybacterium endophyticum]
MTTAAHEADPSAASSGAPAAGRLVHLGIGNFSRAHTLPYTADASTAEDTWRVTAFTGRSPAIAETLSAQRNRYGLVVREAGGDQVRLIDVIDAVHPADDLEALQRLLADPEVSVVTLTITEKGYAAGDDPAVSAPARLALALRARREAGVEEPIALVSCDNLPGNGEVLRAAVLSAADEQTRAWFDDHVDVVSTMVDRITPSASAEDQRIVEEATGFADHATVVTEPFTEWVVQDSFRGRRPAWERSGAQLVEDVEVHEKRKLRLLNGAHSLMAYAGQLAGHERVDQAIGDPGVRALVEALWADARATLPLPADELDAYTGALVERFENPRMADALDRIAADGSVKLTVRALPVITDRGGPDQAPGAVALVAAWTTFVTDRVATGTAFSDPQADAVAEAARIEDTPRRVQALLDVVLDGTAPQDLVDAVVAAEGTLPRA